MPIKNILTIKFSAKSVILLMFLAALPNLFGMINMPTVWGFKIHVFQYFIFLAAILYGPVGGVIAGAFGSAFTALALNNPYVMIGNMILGFFVGYFFRRKWNLILAVLVAYVIQLPWLYYSDIYLAHLPVNIVRGVVIALFFSNIVWGIVTHLTYQPIKKLIKDDGF